MPRIDLNALQAARAELARAQQECARLRAAFASNTERASFARRNDPTDSLYAARAFSIGSAALAKAQQVELQARAHLRAVIAELPDARESIGSIDRDYAIVLFPMRLETRFIRFSTPRERYPLPPQTGELRVRIYPDGLLADSHEPLLSVREVELGQQYWRTTWANADEQDAWTALVATVGATRGAWIVRQCEPTNSAAYPRSTTAVATAPAPVFPVLVTREPRFHRMPEARLLPDRWIVQAFKRHGVTEEEKLRYRIESRAIIEPLALTLAFTADGVIDDRIELAHGLKVDTEIEWTVNFDAAEAAGMAVRIPLITEDLEEGFERLVVLGVKASLPPQEAAQQLQNLLEHHRVSRGVAFVPQGTPTNSTAEVESGYPPPDPRATQSFRTERGAPLAAPGTDGARFMTALGLPAAAADNIAGADRDEQAGARAMATALWPATLGYYLNQMLSSALDVPDQHADLSDATIEALRRHFISLVRGRGPFPAFRVGDVPYGLLPVSLLKPTPTEPSAGLEATLPVVLNNLGLILSNLARDYAPRIGRTRDPDADLIETFRMDASAREVYVRPAVGEETLENVGGLTGINDPERVHEPISLDAKIILGGPNGPGESTLTLGSLLGFPAEESGLVMERPPTERGGPPHD